MTANPITYHLPSLGQAIAYMDWWWDCLKSKTVTVRGGILMHIVQLEERHDDDGGEVRLDTVDVVKELAKFCRNWQRVMEVVTAFIIGEKMDFFCDRPKWVELDPQWAGGKIIGFWVIDQELVDAIHPGEMAPLLYADVAGVDGAILMLAKDLQQTTANTQPLLAPPEPTIQFNELALRLEQARTSGHAIFTLGNDDAFDIAVITGPMMELFHPVEDGEEFFCVEIPAFPQELIASMEAELRGEKMPWAVR